MARPVAREPNTHALTRCGRFARRRSSTNRRYSDDRSMRADRLMRAAAAVRRRDTRLRLETPESRRRPALPPWHRRYDWCGCAFRESAATPAIHPSAPAGDARGPREAASPRWRARSYQASPHFLVQLSTEITLLLRGEARVKGE